MTDQNNQSTDNQVSPEREDAVVALANEFLGRATLAEALSQVSLNAILQLVQNQAVAQGRKQVEEMNDDEVKSLLEAIEKSKTENAANEAVEQVSEETAAAS